MHEMSLAQGILEILQEAAGPDPGARVKNVWLEIGALSAVDPEAIAFCFDAVTRGTVAQGARLNIEVIAGRALCLHCGESVPIARRDDACPLCGRYQVQVADGTQMRVRELELDD